MSHTTEDLTDSEQPVPRFTKSIFTVTTIRISENGKINDQARTVAWFSEKKEAFACLDFNIGSLIECGYYAYAVVEEVFNGLYPQVFKKDKGRWWWKSVKIEGVSEESAPHDREKWIRIDEPPTYRELGITSTDFCDDPDARSNGIGLYSTIG